MKTQPEHGRKLKRSRFFWIIFWIWFVCFLIACSRGSPEAIDGDSFRIGETQYRLACIDVVEYTHPLGYYTKEYLQRWLDRDIELEVVGHGYYGRKIVYVWADGTLVNKEVYQEGLAEFYYDFECKHKQLILEE